MATITTPNTEHYCPVHAGIAWLSSLASAIDASSPNSDVGAYLWNIIFAEKDKQTDCADETAQLYPECLPCFVESLRNTGREE